MTARLRWPIVVAAAFTLAGTAQAAPPAGQLIQAEAPPFSEGIYPCKQCHDGPGDKTRRQLQYHEEIQAAFDHDPEHRWCLDCHDNADRDVLHLSDGDPVPFTESYRLCGQCHGDKYRDWRVGIHGRRIGFWNGEKTYFLCVNCHSPHAPRFRGVRTIVVAGKTITAPSPEGIEPEPPPLHPEEMRP